MKMIIEEIANQLDLSQKDVELAIDHVFSETRRYMIASDRNTIMINQFATFRANKEKLNHYIRALIQQSKNGSPKAKQKLAKAWKLRQTLITK